MNKPEFELKDVPLGRAAGSAETLSVTTPDYAPEDFVFIGLAEVATVKWLNEDGGYGYGEVGMRPAASFERRKELLLDIVQLYAIRYNVRIEEDVWLG